MKRKNKIIEKIKRFLPLLLAVILSGSMILGLWLFSRSKGVNTVSASAESLVSDADNIYDDWSYTYENLIPYPYYDEAGRTINGITIKVEKDGTLLCNGTATGTVVFSIFKDISLNFGMACTLSGLTDGSSSTYYMQPVMGGVYRETQKTTPVTYPLDYGNYMSLYFFIFEGVRMNNFRVKPMLNRGNTALSYIPNLSRIYNQGYDQGYADITAETKEMYRIQAEQAVLEDKETFLEGIFAIVDAPLNVIRNAFNFEILGFNVADLFFFVLTLMLFVFVIKKIKGG